jgi:hypothetical protein
MLTKQILRILPIFVITSKLIVLIRPLVVVVVDRVVSTKENAKRKRTLQK